MATYTSTVFAGYQPKDIEKGVVSVNGSINLGATASSAGDILFLAKIPNGARPLELIVDHTTGATTQVLDYGLSSGGPAGSATSSCFISGGAQASKLRLSVLGLPALVSLSDNDPLSYGILAAKVVSGSATTSLIVNFAFLYSMDGPA